MSYEKTKLLRRFLDYKLKIGQQKILEFKSCNQGLNYLQVDAILSFQRKEFIFIENMRFELLFLFLSKTCSSETKNIIEKMLTKYESIIKNFAVKIPLSKLDLNEQNKE